MFEGGAPLWIGGGKEVNFTQISSLETQLR